MSPAETKAYGIVAALRRNGHDAYTVGGAVRDRIMNQTPHEVDVTTSAVPDEVQRIFPRTVAVGAAFGVVIVIDGDIQVEVATFREDGGYQDGRHPDSVQYSTAERDAERRDFTINALFYDPVNAEVIDFVDGLADIREGVIRAIGDPHRRFSEDYLRMLRAVRFSARFDFPMTPETRAAITAHADRISQVSAERIFDELTKILTGPNPHRAFEMLDETGLLAVILPEIQVMKGVKQPPAFHPEGDVWEHTLLLLKHLDRPDPVLAWSCLLHDVGKPPTFEINHKGRESFPAHAKVGADMTRRMLKRFRCANAFIDTVSEIVYYHMAFADVKKMKRSTLRRMLARPAFDTELALHRIDCLSCHQKLGNYDFMVATREAFQNEPPVPPPLLTGHDVMKTGMPQGPAVGRILAELEELQLSDAVVTRDAALAWLASRVADQ